MWDERFRGSDDLDLWFRLAKITQIWATSRIALRYRLHVNNASKNTVAQATNVWAVLERHLADLAPGERAVYHRESVRYLQGYLGTRLIATAKSALRRGQFLRAGRVIQAMHPFLGSLLTDWTVLKRFLYDCSPRFGYMVAKQLGIKR